MALDHPLIWIAVVVLADLGLRYAVFGRHESVAVDAAIFAMIYNGIEYVHGVHKWLDLPRHMDPWGWRFLVSVLCFVILFGLHRWLQHLVDRRLKASIDKQLQEVQPGFERSAPLVGKILSRTVIVTFTGPKTSRWVRVGKRTWREDAADLLNMMGAAKVREGELLLPWPWRAWGALSFLILGCLSAFTPVLPL